MYHYELLLWELAAGCWLSLDMRDLGDELEERFAASRTTLLTIVHQAVVSICRLCSIQTASSVGI